MKSVKGSWSWRGGGRKLSSPIDFANGLYCKNLSQPEPNSHQKENPGAQASKMCQLFKISLAFILCFGETMHYLMVIANLALLCESVN